ncbi:tryptophan halogenase family protein [Sphingomonas sp.]|uniref:tryptophan halogenase family protein n=1 Tax=Sphingomonas sp. TaxID=28214 RepID=UPI002FDB811D
MTAPLSRVVIAGGGSAGWMAAAALSQALAGTGVAIALVESEEIGTVGVGEATIPPIHGFNQMIGVDEAEFVKATGGTFKLGIEFVDWAKRGARYFHPFGRYGDDFGLVPFHQQWLAARAAGDRTPLSAYSLSTLAAMDGKFGLPQGGAQTVFATYGYAYHFDAGRYAAYLRRLSESRGVVRHEGRIDTVERDAQTGFVRALRLRDGSVVAGDLFLDCTGFRALLIGEALGVPYQDWSHWLPCDRAVAVPSATAGPPLPYTRSTARDAGWQWRIPLQHRIGNGHVYCSGFATDAEAEALLLANLEAAPIGDPRRLRFTTGRRARAWEGNVVAVGLSGGFLEPLESTSLHLIQSAINILLRWFPDSSFDPAVRAEYNRLVAREWDAIRDFLVLHYVATERDDTPFWRHCRNITPPDTLAEKMALFARTGRLLEREGDLFVEASWLSVLLGQGVTPQGFDVLAASIPAPVRAKILGAMRLTIANAAATLPSHEATIARSFRAAQETMS